MSAAAWFGYQNYVALDHPIAGTWEINKKLSMREWYKTGVTAEQEKFLEKVFSSENVRTYHKSYQTWEFNGEKNRSAHTIEETSDNCYVLSEAQGNKTRACVVDDNLYLTVLPQSPKLRTEVYSRADTN